MKRVILGSLLSCMLVGQVFGADYAHHINGRNARIFTEGFLEGSATALVPLAMYKGGHVGIDAAVSMLNAVGIESRMKDALETGIALGTIVGLFCCWSYNIWRGARSWDSGGLDNKVKIAGRISGSSIASLAALKLANLAGA